MDPVLFLAIQCIGAPDETISKIAMNAVNQYEQQKEAPKLSVQQKNKKLGGVMIT